MVMMIEDDEGEEWSELWRRENLSLLGARPPCRCPCMFNVLLIEKEPTFVASLFFFLALGLQA